MRAITLIALLALVGCASPSDLGCAQLSDCPLDRACVRSVPGGICAGTSCAAGETIVAPRWDGVPASLCLAECTGACREGWVCDRVSGQRVCVPRCDMMPSSFCRGYRCLSDGRCNSFCVDDNDCANARCIDQECR